MVAPIKLKAVFWYSLQVWLTSAFIGSFCLLWYAGPAEMTYWVAYWEAFLISLLFSSPSFLLLLAVVSNVARRSWRPRSKKLVVAAAGLVLSALAFLVLVWLNGLNLESLLFVIYSFYTLPMLAAIFIFRLGPAAARISNA